MLVPASVGASSEVDRKPQAREPGISEGRVRLRSEVRLHHAGDAQVCVPRADVLADQPPRQRSTPWLRAMASVASRDGLSR